MNSQVVIYYILVISNPLDYELLNLNLYLVGIYNDFMRYGISEEEYQKYIAENMDKYKAMFKEESIISIEPRMFEN